MWRTLACVVALPALAACQPGSEPRRDRPDNALDPPAPEGAADNARDLPVAAQEERFATRCAGSGYARDPGDAGLVIRAAPDAASREIGRLHVSVPNGPSFRIIDVAPGWIRIEGADPMTQYAARTGPPRNFTGQGWIDAKQVGFELTDSTMSEGSFLAYDRPDFGAAVVDRMGVLNALHVPDELVLLECTGAWLKLRYKKRMPVAKDAPPPRDRYGDGPWVTGWFKVTPYVTYQKQASGR